MDAGTAAHRLIKDILFKFVNEGGFVCHHCGGALERINFSVEHKTPWLDSADPAALFFDLENIAFSHINCNIAKARRPNQVCFTVEDRLKHRAETERKRWSGLSKEDQRKIRRQKYESNGA